MVRELTLDRLPKRVLAKLDIETVFKASRCVIAAEQLRVFRKLHGGTLTAGEIARRTGIRSTYCEGFLEVLVFLGLLIKKAGRYGNSALADSCFVKGRSVDWTRLWSEECAKDYEALAVMEEVITSGEDWRKLLDRERKPDYELAATDPEWARDFTYALYDLYKPDAELLAKHLDLTGYRALLDVGGGSGVMSLALTKRYPKLRACVLDLKYVCDAARQIIRKEGMSKRVRTLAGDMNKSIPPGYDVVMFWNIGWIDTRVMKMAYNSLSDGGMVVRSCTPPQYPATPSPSVFFHEYFSVRPKVQRKTSAMESLKEAGFRSVKYRRISAGIGMITAIKGRRR